MNKALKTACSKERTPMPNWLKTLIGVCTTLFCGGIMAWAAGIKADTSAMVLKAEENHDHITILEERCSNEATRLEEIKTTVDEIAPQQIRIEGKIDLLLQSQKAQAAEIADIKERIR